MATAEFDALPSEFANALSGIDDVAFRKELNVHSIPAPEGIAPHAVAWSATVDPQSGGDHGISRLVVLYDPATQKDGRADSALCALRKLLLIKQWVKTPSFPKLPGRGLLTL